MPDQEKLLRYVVLHHTGYGRPHFDLMFETSTGSALATWRADEWPLETGMRVESLGDHRRDYLNYEGPVSGGRGTVSRVDGGTHSILERSPTRFIATCRSGLEIELKLVEGRTWLCEVNEL